MKLLIFTILLYLLYIDPFQKSFESNSLISYLVLTNSRKYLKFFCKVLSSKEKNASI